MQKTEFKQLSKEWLEYKKMTVKYSTYIKYKNIIHYHLKTICQDQDLNDWNDEDYQNWYKELLKRKSLSKSTLKSINCVLKNILNYGEDKYQLKHIDISYMKVVGEKRNIHILSDEEIKKLASYCLTNINATTLAVYISLYTGMRIGEICGLKWEDVDLNNQIIVVSKTVQRIQDENSKTKKTKKMVFSPKTKSSQRIVVMTDFLAEYLNVYKKMIKPDANDFFIISNSIEIPEVRNIQRNFKKICLQLDIKLNFHALRHSFATNCIKYEMDVKTLSELLGHSTISTTMNLYVHPTIEYKKEQINKIPKF